MVVLLLVFPTNVLAQPRALFLLSDFRSWGEAAYELNGYSRSSSGSRTYRSADHDLEESYHFEGLYGLLDHRWWSGRFSMDLGLAQTVSHSDGRGDDRDWKGVRGEFYLDGRLFDKSPAPGSFLTSYAQERVLVPFGRDYDRTVTSNSVGLQLRNDYLPASILYRSNETQTEGLSLDRTQTVEEMRLQVSHRIHSLSQSGFSASRLSNATTYAASLPALKSDSYEVSLNNQLTLGNVARPHTLDSRYRLSSETGSRQSERTLWEERLRLTPGKALTVSAAHTLNRDETEGQRRDRQREEISLEHRLFSSLVTRFQADLEKREYNNGEEQTRGGSLNLNYSKQLAGESRLGLNLGRRVAMTERDLAGNELVVVAETLVVTDGRDFLIQNFIVPSTVRVFSADRLVLYQEGIDYELEVVGVRTELIALDPAVIPTGTTLSVDYSYTVDPSIDFTTTTDNLSILLNALANMWEMQFNYGRSRQEPDSPDPDSLYLSHTRFYLLGIDHNFDGGSAGVQYEDVRSDWQNQQSVTGNLFRRRDLLAGQLALRLKNQYTLTETLLTSAEGLSLRRESRRNILSLSADFGRVVHRNGRLNLRGLGRVSRGDGIHEDNLSMTLGYQYWLGRMEFRLQSEVEWTWSDESRERNDYLYLYVRRYF
ncbi:hypothetical protein [Desulfuromonas sp. AOP6]|uniref:hypothetical protein n=1 Tax=Desulfuromonas sp. AOP6 TaxID=1566351 RepID=UPI00127C45F7|nr:hypothetical protein [Desulfuromonas sp. AOP6]BCA79392.1 hypothetical protein AOP6_1179 [Desulfuromonas sp. AOP6]